MELKVHNIAIDEVKAYKGNPVNHDDVSEISDSIVNFGFVNPIILNKDNVIIAGHGRYLAAKELEMKDIPAITLNHLSDKDVKALRIADNKLVKNSRWDIDLLRQELSDLKKLSFDVRDIGFSQSELDEMFKVPDIKEDKGPLDNSNDDVPDRAKEKVITCHNCGAEITI